MLKNKFRTFKLSQAGDTVVEVMIATVLIGFVLVGAYTLANHSLINERQAEEEAQATQLVQGQLEMLRAYLLAEGSAMTNTSTVTGYIDAGSDTGTFCMIGYPNSNSFAPVQIPNSGCTVAANGVTAASGQQPAFILSIGGTTNVASGVTTFNATATWSQAGGGTQIVTQSDDIDGQS